MSRAPRPPVRRVSLLPLVLVVAVAGTLLLPSRPFVRGDSPPPHLVVSEIVTGAASASDEFIEIYNPTDASLPLEGLEVVYVSASGLTVGRRAAWEAGAPELGPGRHLLIANEAGIYAGIADATYATGMAASGGSVALRIQGASTAVDAVGWGTAASTWLEGTPAPAPAPGESLERRPGGAAGSTQDTDDNATDFVVRAVPDPRNRASAPVPDPTGPSPTTIPSTSPSSAPSPTPGSPSPTPGSPSPSESAAPTPPVDAVMTVAAARGAPDGTTVTVEGVALTGATFGDGGGHVADATGGVAVLMSSGDFHRGARLRVTGTIDDRYFQRTIRASATTVAVLGSAAEPEPLVWPTGAVGEDVESRLVRVSGRIMGAPTALSAGPAFDVDDGSGPVRVLVATASGIDTTAWTTGSAVDVIGVVGQRDSTGSGTAGYRLQPRDPADVVSVAAPEPTDGSASPSSTPGASEPPGDGVMTIAAAREAARGTRVRVRGTVTLPPGVIHAASTVIQDATGAVLLRVGDEVGELERGRRVEVQGTRSTLGGMETIRVTIPALTLGDVGEPEPVTVRTGDAGEAFEAQLVRVRGAVVSSARRIASRTVSFEIDDGSGPVRVYQPATLGADPSQFTAGAWVEATGILGQETTGAQPLRGYRVWPRAAAEVRVVAGPTGGPDEDSHGSGSTGSPGSEGGAGAASTLGALEEAGLADLRIGATLVHGPWPELGIAGLLWDGTRVVAIAAESLPGVRDVLAEQVAPLALELTGLRALGAHDDLGVPLVALGQDPGDVVVAGGPTHDPAARLSERPAWVSMVGRLQRDGRDLELEVGSVTIDVAWRCRDSEPPRPRTVQAIGIGTATPARLIVGCGGVRAAPTLVGRAAAPAALAAGPGPRANGEPASSWAPGTSRSSAAALLAIGALTLIGGVVAARRLRPEPEPEPGSGATEGTVTGEPTPDAPPVLTLVSVPHERSSR